MGTDLTPLVKDSIVASVVKQFQDRSDLGQKKYGTTLDRTDLSPLDWVQHAQEELMDGILYLEKLKQVIKASRLLEDTLYQGTQPASPSTNQPLQPCADTQASPESHRPADST
jgi:hypothetical protein